MNQAAISELDESDDLGFFPVGAIQILEEQRESVHLSHCANVLPKAKLGETSLAKYPSGDIGDIAILTIGTEDLTFLLDGSKEFLACNPGSISAGYRKISKPGIGTLRIFRK
jgi:hypothetical protein